MAPNWPKAGPALDMVEKETPMASMKATPSIIMHAAQSVERAM